MSLTTIRTLRHQPSFVSSLRLTLLLREHLPFVRLQFYDLRSILRPRSCPAVDSTSLRLYKLPCDSLQSSCNRFYSLRLILRACDRTNFPATPYRRPVFDFTALQLSCLRFYEPAITPFSRLTDRPTDTLFPSLELRQFLRTYTHPLPSFLQSLTDEYIYPF